MKTTQAAIQKETSETHEMSREEAARYISEMLSSLRHLAVRADMTFLVYLLDMACIESAHQSAHRDS